MWGSASSRSSRVELTGQFERSRSYSSFQLSRSYSSQDVPAQQIHQPAALPKSHYSPSARQSLPGNPQPSRCPPRATRLSRYQWRKNGSNIAGATSSTYTTPSTTSADSGSTFQVMVSNSSRSTLSSHGYPHCRRSPEHHHATSEPDGECGADGDIYGGSDGCRAVELSVAEEPGEYRGSDIGKLHDPGDDERRQRNELPCDHNKSGYQRDEQCGDADGEHRAKHHDAAGKSDGECGTNGDVHGGGDRSAPLSYQWQKNQVNIAGATSASYTTPATTSADNGTSFRVIVTNPVTSVTSNAATLTVNTGPSITTQPANQTVNVGQTATFTVVATGAAPLSYQWQKNQVNIAGATSASYTTPATTNADNGTSFQVIVTNPVRSITSSAAILTVNSPPTITAQPANQSVAVGQTATFTVVASGTAPLTYQWQKNQVNIAGATAATYTTPPTTNADNGASFQVIVTNPVTSITSSAAILTVVTPGTVSVLTQHNDNARTGQNTSETILNASNVNVNQFGKLFALPTDGLVYAQPLYVPGVTINGGFHNVVIIATEADSLYAYDADAGGAPLWKASMVDAAHGAGSGETPLNSATTLACTDVQPLIGITSTPVIDPTSNTIYVEAKSTDGVNYFHRLHALDSHRKRKIAGTNSN